MQELFSKENFDLNQISLTGMRAIIILGLLIEAPRSLWEIKNKFVELGIMDKDASDDILRIDLSTLRKAGCEITRADVKTNFRYVLKKHPFTLILSEEEVSILKKIYKRVKECANIQRLLQYDELFRKIAIFVNDEKIKEELYGISVLKGFDADIIKELSEDCKERRVVKLIYKSPDTNKESEKEIAALKLVFQNDKIYLYGYNHNNLESVILNVKRIKAILSRYLNKDDIEVKQVCVKFFLKNFGIAEVEENETITEKRDDGYIIEGKYHNEFIAMQRMLSFGANCIVLEPQEFREKIIQKYRNMKDIYND